MKNYVLPLYWMRSGLGVASTHETAGLPQLRFTMCFFHLYEATHDGVFLHVNDHHRAK